MSVFGQLPSFFDNESLAIPHRQIDFVDDGVIVTYDFDHVNYQDDTLYVGKKILSYEDFGISEELGRPALPFCWDSFVIPEGHIASVSVIDSVRFIYPKVSIAPGRPLLCEGSVGYTKDEIPNIEAYSGFFPKCLISDTIRFSYFGIPIISICFNPIKYNNNFGRVKIFKRIKYKISFIPMEGQGGSYSSLQNPSIRKFVVNNTLNGENICCQIDPQPLSATENILSADNYLILSVPKYKHAINTFAEWKRILGFNVTVDTTYVNWSSKQVRARLDTLYQRNEYKHLLIIGDYYDVLGQHVQDGYKPHHTDYNYGCKDGHEQQEVYVGRISVESPEDADIVIKKIIDYEKKPVVDSLFYKKGIHCAYFQDGEWIYNGNDIIGKVEPNGVEDNGYVYHVEQILQYMTNQEGYIVNRAYCANDTVSPQEWSAGQAIPDFLKRPNFAWDADSSEIIRLINDGAFYVLHRDHGKPFCWENPFFTTANINSLQNGNKLPVVFSLNCSSGFYYHHSCFAESFLQKENGGCVGIIAASERSQTALNNYFSKGIFNSIWPGLLTNANTVTSEPVYSLGEILRYGLEYVKKKSTYGTYKYFREIYHCFGDPSMELYTSQPTPFQCVSIQRNDSAITVTAPEASRISFYDREAHRTYISYRTNVTFLTNSRDVVVCISGHNKIPHIDYPNIYIQNETIVGDSVITGNNIITGRNVTSYKPEGDAVFDGGRITLIGNDIRMDAGTEIKIGTELIIKNDE